MKKKRVLFSAVMCLLMIVGVVGSGWAQQTQTAQYKNSQWRVVLEKDGRLDAYGAGHGTWMADKNVNIGVGVDQFWVAGSWRGPVIVFRKDKSYYVTLRRYDKGNEIASGRLQPGNAAVTGVRVAGRTYGAHIYMNLANGKQKTYSIWQHPNMKGHFESGIKN